MSLTRIISIFFFLIALGLAGYLAYSIKFKIEEDQRIDRQEDRVISKLKMIRDAEIAYQAVTGDYTGSFDTLVSFLDTGTLYLTQRTEEIITLSYGKDSVIVEIDTIGQIPVKDSLFVIKEQVNSLIEGEINEVNVSKGDRVKKGDVLFIVENANGKLLRIRSPKTAEIKEIFSSQGSKVEVEEPVLSISYPRIDNIKNLPYLPGSNEKKFDLFAGTIVRGNVEVDVFEAKDTNPVNPKRRKEEGKGPLKVGSRTDVSTAGNWE